MSIVSAVVIATVGIVAGAMVLLSRNTAPDVAKDQLITEDGIHWHPRLSVYVKGVKQELSGDIGVGAVHQPMHTHPDDYKDGVVHIEIPGTVTKQQLQLSNFFKIWGREFNAKTARMLVNGTENKELEAYAMRDGDRIEIRYD